VNVDDVGIEVHELMKRYGVSLPSTTPGSGHLLWP
jgi:hypothetical protein